MDTINAEHIVKTGTTTLAIKCKDGIVVAADKRATAGYLIAQKDTQKIQNITNNIVVTMAGSASDSQYLIKVAQAELRLKNIRTQQEVSVKEAANLMARMVYNNIRTPSMLPGISHFIMAGKDSTGYYVYDIFPDGTISQCKDYISSGSGSVMAYGVLETLYDPKITIEKAKEMAIKCVNAAMSRDIASGNGIDIYTVTEEGAKQVFTKDVEMRVDQ